MEKQPEDKPFPRYFYALILGMVGFFGTLSTFLVVSWFTSIRFGMDSVLMYAVPIGGVLAVIGWTADRE